MYSYYGNMFVLLLGRLSRVESMVKFMVSFCLTLLYVYENTSRSVGHFSDLTGLLISLLSLFFFQIEKGIIYVIEHIHIKLLALIQTVWNVGPSALVLIEM